MARFEMTLSNGETVLVDHAAAGMTAFLSELDRNDFLLLSEVKGGSSTPARDVIVASSQVTLVRPFGDHPHAGAEFQQKR